VDESMWHFIIENAAAGSNSAWHFLFKDANEKQ
jgi:hypothetical protein